MTNRPAIVSQADVARGRRAELPFTPRGLSRDEAARYVGVSASLFDQMVTDGRMPVPKVINRRRVWDRLRLDAAFADLPDVGEVNPWDGEAA